MPRGDKSSRLGCPSSVFRTHFFDFICSWAAPQLLRRRRRCVSRSSRAESSACALRKFFGFPFGCPRVLSGALRRFFSDFIRPEEPWTSFVVVVAVFPSPPRARELRECLWVLFGCPSCALECLRVSFGCPSEAFFGFYLAPRGSTRALVSGPSSGPGTVRDDSGALRIFFSDFIWP